ncbi:MAG: 2,3-bisphosphoglycerate-independent phosphoglycerate mutase [Deltaproteobacteria bacterium]|nr:2,3-bisphosphoglycerate-independent phosphoglycerate mutase [Deltaproteobacteria bacterium]
MDITSVWEELAMETGGKILYIVLDGGGGLPDSVKGQTELEYASTPNLDNLAMESSCGLLEIIGPGITPGSGPGHQALFGYDPLKYRTGRGVLSALGIDFDLKEGDIAARINFATVDEDNIITDRRAGRIDTETNKRLCNSLMENIKLEFNGDLFIKTVSEHRAVLVLRGEELGGNLHDTDPQKTGAPPAGLNAGDKYSEKTIKIINDLLVQAKKILADEDRANMLLFRGFEKYQPLSDLKKRFRLKGICIAEYPMYRGISRMLGMDISSPPDSIEESFKRLTELYGNDYDLYFLHVKQTDSAGEDANFEKKVKVIEQIDQMIPIAVNLRPDVIIVTSDHSSPALMGMHSWHPVPVMINSKYARNDSVLSFNEKSCIEGSLGIRPAIHLMGLALAHAGRLKKFGA